MEAEKRLPPAENSCFPPAKYSSCGRPNQKFCVHSMKNRLLSTTLLPSLVAGLAAIPSLSRADLIASWDFNSATPYGVSVDSRAGLAPRLLGGAALTPDAGGRSGAAGDKAMRFGTAQQRLHLANASYFDATGANDVMSVTFWIRHAAIRNATAVSFLAPAAPGGRGFQSHAPWSNSNIYFDTAGCCDGGTTRINVNPGVVWTDWHHIALVKNLSTKEIYVDGNLALSGTNTDSIALAFTELVIGNSALGTGYGEAVNGDMDDVAVFDHALSPADVALLASGGPVGAPPATSVATTVTDSDGDGLPDMWEKRIAGNLTTLVASAGDNDSDGSSNVNELAKGTNPTVGDTDGDGLADGVETGTGVWVSGTDRGTSALAADTDGDGLSDGVETNTGSFVSASNSGTNPNVADHDGDLVPDGTEVAYGSSPTSAASTPIAPGVPTLLAWWDFNDDTNAPNPKDRRANHLGVLQGSATYSLDAEGVSAAAGDKALNLPASGSRMRLDSIPWVNMGTRVDKLTVSMWVKVPGGPAASSSFWFFSPTAGSGNRGFQAHAPYGGGTIYFDTAGCCNPDTRLSGTPAADWTVWNHLVLMKNGAEKKVYLNGTMVLSSTGAAPLQTDFNALNVGSDNGNGSVIGYIDDFAIFGSALNDQEITDLATRAKTPLQIGSSSDSDADGLPDSWEYLYFPADLTKLTAAGDFDADGSPDAQELPRNTNPTDSDSDDDGFLDGVETKTGTWAGLTNTGTDPLKADTDGDGLPDGAERRTGTYVDQTDTGTDPLLRDTDGDTFIDSVEGPEGSNPNLATSMPFTPGQTTLLALWSFNNASDPAAALDSVRSRPGTVTGSAVYTADGLGRTGLPGDLGMCTAGGGVTASAAFLNMASPGDKVSISFWQNLIAPQSSSSFWITSPGSTGVGRGMQAHVPWGNNNIYFDTSGCCDAGAQRLEGAHPSINVSMWHQWTFVKDGSRKAVYRDGREVLTGTGANPLPSDFQTLIMGSSADNLPINGCIDDFAVFAGALTTEQITRLSCGESPTTVLSPGAPLDFAISSIVNNGDGTVKVIWKSQPGCVYDVETSPDMTAGSWTPVATDIPGFQGTTEIGLTNPGERFFIRVVH